MQLKFVCQELETGFYPKDLQIILNLERDWSSQLSVTQAEMGVTPIYLESEHSHLFGLYPTGLDEIYPSLYDDLVVELTMHLEDLDYTPRVDPALHIQVEVYDGGIRN